MTDNDKRPNFWKEAKSYREKMGILVAVLGSVATIVAFLKTPYGPFVLPLVILIFVTGYAFWEPFMGKSTIVTPRSQREPWRSRLRKVPWWGWSSLAAIPLLILFWGGRSWYTQREACQPSNRFIVLIADFHQIDTETDPIAMTDKLIHDLRAALVDKPEAEVVPLCQRISKREPSDFARNVGAEHKATIVIWGAYAATPTMVDLWAHFEVLEKPALLPTEVARAGEIGMEVQFGQEQWESLELRDRVVSELTYLTMFTLGLARYEAGDAEYAISHFSSALTQVGESPMQMAPLNRCVVYFYRGKTYCDGGDYDRAITDFDEAIWLCPNYAAAYNGRGSAYAHKGDHHRAVADWDEGTGLEITLPPSH